MSKGNEKSRKKVILNTVFIAMVVFTVAMTVATIVNTSNRKQKLTIPDDVDLVQIETINGNVSDDAKIAVISTDLGDMAAELYSQFAPETVANFTELAETGYYDGTYVYEIEKGIQFGAGCKYSDGTLPEGYDKSKETVGPEISPNLWPVKGALLSCGLMHSTMWRGQEIFSGSRFMMIGSVEYSEDDISTLTEINDNAGIAEMFLKYGGTPNVSQQITVFAQIFEGWDVLDVILDASVDEETLSPLQDIEINTVKIMTFGEYKKSSESTES